MTLGTLHGRQVAVSSGYAGAIAIWNLNGTQEIIHTGSLITTLLIDDERRILAGGTRGPLAIDVSESLLTSFG